MWHACILPTAGGACWSRARRLPGGGFPAEVQASRCYLARVAPQLAPVTTQGTTLCCQAPAQSEQPLSAMFRKCHASQVLRHTIETRRVLSSARMKARICNCVSCRLQQTGEGGYRPEASSGTMARGLLLGPPERLTQACHACVLRLRTKEPGCLQLQAMKQLQAPGGEKSVVSVTMSAKRSYEMRTLEFMTAPSTAS